MSSVRSTWSTWNVSAILQQAEYVVTDDRLSVQSPHLDVEQSVKQSVEQSVEQSVKQSVKQSVEQSPQQGKESER